MRCTAGNSRLGTFTVQSPVADTSNCGLGANAAAISTLFVSIRSSGAFSQREPPCIWNETMFTGAE